MADIKKTITNIIKQYRFIPASSGEKDINSGKTWLCMPLYGSGVIWLKYTSVDFSSAILLFDIELKKNITVPLKEDSCNIFASFEHVKAKYYKSKNSFVNITGASVLAGYKDNSVYKIVFEEGSLLTGSAFLFDEQHTIMFENESIINFEDIKTYAKHSTKKGSLHGINKSDLEHVARVISHIESHPSQNLSLKEFSEIAFISERKLTYIFRLVTGKTIGQYRRDVRLKTADILLKNNEIPLKQIASKLGFSSINSFSNFYKKNKGLMPSEQRKKFSSAK